MSVSNSQSELPAEFHGRATPWMVAALVFNAVIAIAYLLELRSRAHFLFFPLALVALIVFFLVRRDSRVMKPGITCRGLLGLNVMLVTVAIFAGSTWLAFTGCLFGCVAGLTISRDRLTGRTLLPLLLLLLPIFRPPLEIDQEIVNAFDYQESETASRILHWSGFVHFRGVAGFESPEFTIPYSAAGSDLLSPFFFMFVAAIIGTFLRRPMLQTALLMMMGVIWGFVLNTACMVSVVTARLNPGIDLTPIGLYVCCGFVVLLGFVMLTLSTDQFFQFLLGPVCTRNQQNAGATLLRKERDLNRLERLWNFVFDATTPEAKP